MNHMEIARMTTLIDKTLTKESKRTRGKSEMSLHEVSQVASRLPASATRAQVKDELQKHGFAMSDKNCERVETRFAEICLQRRSRYPQRATGTGSGRAPVLLPKGTPHDRLNGLRRRTVLQHAERLVRNGAAGGCSFLVRLTKDPNEVDYVIRISQNRNTYRGRFKGYRALEDHHVITVPVDWRVRVLAAGLADAGGMLTLSAQRLDCRIEGVALYSATWVEQGRGYSVHVIEGFIAKAGELDYHATTQEDALRGIARKVRGHQTWLSDYASSKEEFVSRYARYGTLRVSLNDAYAVGACEFGVRSWCRSVGIDMNKSDVSIEALLEGFLLSPLIEVRKTVLYVVRKARRSGVLASADKRALNASLVG
jgi:hypothetical protein